LAEQFSSSVVFLKLREFGDELPWCHLGNMSGRALLKRRREKAVPSSLFSGPFKHARRHERL
jgi:hypothetical protein